MNAMHPRISLHQVAMLDEGTSAFIQHCDALGLDAMTLVTPALFQPGTLAVVERALAGGGPRVGCINHVFAVHPDLECDSGKAASELTRAIDVARDLGCNQIYLLSGGRGGLDWEGAAARFAELIAPLRDYGEQWGVRLLVENAAALNADIHIAHTLPDAILLAETAGIGLCLELHACWMEAGLKDTIRRAMPLTGLVQVSDYVLGDRTAPCRAVPGDGVIPLERLLGQVLEAGYQGYFDLELIGPRIAAEGPRAASARAANYLSELLTRLGA